MSPGPRKQVYLTGAPDQLRIMQQGISGKCVLGHILVLLLILTGIWSVAGHIMRGTELTSACERLQRHGAST